jgi:hypothetical protein
MAGTPRRSRNSSTVPTTLCAPVLRHARRAMARPSSALSLLSLGALIDFMPMHRKSCPVPSREERARVVDSSMKTLQVEFAFWGGEHCIDIHARQLTLQCSARKDCRVTDRLRRSAHQEKTTSKGQARPARSAIQRLGKKGGVQWTALDAVYRTGAIGLRRALMRVSTASPG